MDRINEIELVINDPYKIIRNGEPVLDRRHWKVITNISGNIILEVGPGTGKLGVFLTTIGKSVDFLDIDLLNLKKIEAAYFKHFPDEHRKFYHDDISDPGIIKKIGRRRYDTVVACEVIEHVINWKKAISNMMNLSNQVILTTPVGKSYFDKSHRHFFKISDFNWLVDLDKWEIKEFISMLTKLDDIRRNQMCFVIELRRK